MVTPQISYRAFLSVDKLSMGGISYRIYRTSIVFDADRGCDSFMTDGDKRKSLLDQICCQAVDVEDKLLSFGCLVPEGGIDAL
jgi:hypothetical protein